VADDAGGQVSKCCFRLYELDAFVPFFCAGMVATDLFLVCRFEKEDDKEKPKKGKNGLVSRLSMKIQGKS